MGKFVGATSFTLARLFDACRPWNFRTKGRTASLHQINTDEYSRIRERIQQRDFEWKKQSQECKGTINSYANGTESKSKDVKGTQT